MYPPPEPTHIDHSLVPAPPEPEPSPGLRLSMSLLWLLFGLPASALLFLGIPGLFARIGVDRLEHAEVPIEVWSELEPWIALAVLMAVVNARSAFAHRRQLPSDEQRQFRRRAWFVLGGINFVAWRGLLALELVPRTELNPLLHYFALSGLMVWGSASLAWISGRALSFVFAPVERYAMRTPALRGGLVTAGPLSLVAVVAVTGTALELDADELGDDLRVLVADNFEDEWSVGEDGPEVIRGALGPGSTGTSAGSNRPPPPDPPDDWFSRCIEILYRGPPQPPLYQRGVTLAQSYTFIDAESAAADAALSVCTRQKPPRELSSYYTKVVINEARDQYRKQRRFGQCRVPSHEHIGLPPGEAPEDCLLDKLCQLSTERPQDYEVLVLELTGHDDREIARHLGIKRDAAKKRRQRAERRMREYALECIE
ncbi:RNA polymerase sigma factor [Enhygromyxa salina]|uniref:Sigma-70 family RNA polymerase sigma factor n=1 Tax=Enhygromyxa salina TaxID=215803 RepID=A0A2S9Y613_9BACT|nr:sigma-70 family RNA polymerase sigma factor [Enhygromyxa salina]PRQ00534.1 hypothetical protein ENSA7_60280 [Enhygromyxa salina]